MPDRKKQVEVVIPCTQLPTPRPSQSPRRYDSSCFGFGFDSDEELTPPPSSPSGPSTSLPTSPVTAPLTPSKRRFNAPPSPVSEQGESPNKKRVAAISIPQTGVPATPGRGNLFSSITNNDVVEASRPTADDVDEDDSDLPLLVAPRFINDKENLQPARSQSIALPRGRSKSFHAAGVNPKRIAPSRRAVKM